MNMLAKHLNCTNIKTLYQSLTDVIFNKVKNGIPEETPDGIVRLILSYVISIPALEAMILGITVRVYHMERYLELPINSSQFEFNKYVKSIPQWLLTDDIGDVVNRISQLTKRRVLFDSADHKSFIDCKSKLQLLSRFYNLENNIPAELIEEYSKLFDTMTNREKYGLLKQIRKIIGSFDTLISNHLENNEYEFEEIFSNFTNRVVCGEFDVFFAKHNIICLYYDICQYIIMQPNATMIIRQYNHAEPDFSNQLKFYMTAVKFKTHLYAMLTAVNTDLPNCECGVSSDCPIHC
jgi:hypothetical protein